MALRVTALTAPQGFRADGADVALFDIEAVDDNGERCPTFQRRVDFTLEGPGVWRGGYNSGKERSINQTFLDLEAGLNRVAVRATRTPGRIVLRATAPGLRAAEATVAVEEYTVANGAGRELPFLWTAARLPAVAPHWDFAAQARAMLRTGSGPGEGGPMLGRFTRGFNYSGPSGTIVHVETGARAGRPAYVDAPVLFSSLPGELEGADWVQAANQEATYHAVDLLQLSVLNGATVFVAHDDAIERPAWLREKFRPTELKLRLADRILSIFSRKVIGNEALTLGANAETPLPTGSLMYVVFVK